MARFPCGLGGAGVSSCHPPRRRYAAVMGPYTRHADYDPIGEGGLLGLRVSFGWVNWGSEPSLFLKWPMRRELRGLVHTVPDGSIMK